MEVSDELFKPRPLEGNLWLSCSEYIVTLHSVANPAELGAEVIKVEMPRKRDATRRTSPSN